VQRDGQPQWCGIAAYIFEHNELLAHDLVLLLRIGHYSH
jgi:hypothetical protein